MSKHRLSLLSVLATALVLFSVRPAQAVWLGGSHDDFSYATLSGINAVSVSMVGFSPSFRRYGLNSSAVKAQVEQRLRAAGLKVVSAAEAQRMPGAALLVINLSTAESPYYYYSYSAAVEVKQKVALPSRKGAFVPVTAWSNGQSGIVLPSNLQNITGVVMEYVDRFISDYRTQNPDGSGTAH